MDATTVETMLADLSCSGTMGSFPSDALLQVTIQSWLPPSASAIMVVRVRLPALITPISDSDSRNLVNSSQYTDCYTSQSKVSDELTTRWGKSLMGGHVRNA